MTDKILLVGINKYPNCPLNGCINDITDMADLLVNSFGVAQENIRLLADDRATTSAIIERLNWLVDVKPGDRCLFHFSGHGVQVATRNQQQEVDGLDEAICPVDFNWSESRMIRDKQFYSIFSKIPSGVKFNWISDSCHSGDLTRSMNTPRRYPLPADIAWRNSIAINKGFTVHRPGKPVTKPTLPNLDVGFISGCKPNQTSADANINGKYNGVLTYYLIRELKKNISLPISNVINNVVSQLARAGYTQHPTVDGNRSNLPFLG